MKKFTLAAALCLSACASPDVTKEVGALQTAVAAMRAQHDKSLARQAKAELRLLEQKEMAAGTFDFDFPAACLRETDAEINDFGACKIESFAEISQEMQLSQETSSVTAYQVRRGLISLEGYFAALATISAADSSEALGKSAKELAVSAGGFSKNAGAQSAADLLTEDPELFGRLASGAANHYRARSLQQIVQQAEPNVTRICEAASAWFDQEAQVLKRLQTFNEATEAMKAASSGASVAVQQRRLTELRAAAKELRDAYNESPARQFDKIMLLHRELGQAASRGANRQEIVTTVELTQDLLAAIEGAS